MPRPAQFARPGVPVARRGSPRLLSTAVADPVRLRGAKSAQRPEIARFVDFYIDQDEAIVTEVGSIPM